MRPLQEFLDAVLPDKGAYCVVGIQNSKVRQLFVETKDEIAERAADLVERGVNAYFAVASFSEGSNNRTQDNAAWMKSFWLDLDCGPEKDYPSQEEALKALPDFIRKANLPAPLLVNSGNGVHVYWPLHDEIDSATWMRIARKLKAACRVLGLNADPAVTADAARILRVPTTVNFKDPENPKTVHVMGDEYEVTTADDIEENLDALDLPEDKPATHDKGELSETAKALIGVKTSKFSKIARRSINGYGCNALRYIITNQDGLDEPLWRAGLSIAWACEDGEKAIHKMSSKHSAYDPKATLEKAKLTKGPYTCETIAEIMPELCEGCPHRGKITSPIQLGSEVKRDEDGMFMIEPPKEKQPEPVTEEVEATVKESLEVEEVPSDDEEEVKGFKPPFPYFRAKGGGIYREEGEGDEAQEIKVYEYDLYPFKRIVDPNDGESVVFRLHLPIDGDREFTIPLAQMMASDQFRNALGYQGVVASATQMKEIMNYSIKFVKELQKIQKANQARLQFGWDDKREKFIVGNRTYCPGGKVEHNPASSTTADIMRHLDIRGTLDDWKAAANVFARPGMEPLQLAVAAGFAAPLMPFTGVSGVTLNLISNDSGTGKTMAGHVALSMYGRPEDLRLAKNDTNAARLHRIGVMNNLPVLSDEMTNISPDEISNLLYAVSQGRGRHRMERDSNRERKNLSTWKTIFITNSNASFTSKLAKAKSRPDGEMMRLIEMNVERHQVDGADVLFDRLDTSHGHAGDIYIRWLVENNSHIAKLYDKERERIYKKIGKRMEERFWVSALAMKMVGLRIGQKLGLIDYDLVHLLDWICEYIESRRKEVEAEKSSADGLVGEFLMDHSNGILAIGTRINPRSGDNVWMPSRSGRLVARFELDENLMYISKKAFREYCVDRQYTESEALKETSKSSSSYQYIKTAKKRMMAGTSITAPGVEAHIFKCNPEEAEAVFEALSKQNSNESEED